MPLEDMQYRLRRHRLLQSLETSLELLQNYVINRTYPIEDAEDLADRLQKVVDDLSDLNEKLESNLQ